MWLPKSIFIHDVKHTICIDVEMRGGCEKDT